MLSANSKSSAKQNPEKSYKIKDDTCFTCNIHVTGKKSSHVSTTSDSQVHGTQIANSGEYFCFHLGILDKCCFLSNTRFAATFTSDDCESSKI